jgi:flagellar hook-basal body complex protein FliE
MPMPAIAPLNAVNSVTSILGGNALDPAGGSGVGATAWNGGASGGPSFAAVLGHGLSAVQSAQSKADGLAVQAATGDLTNIHDYTIAATQASLVTELAAAIRTKGVDALNQIMGMQA